MSVTSGACRSNLRNSMRRNSTSLASSGQRAYRELLLDLMNVLLDPRCRATAFSC
jgi:hypothetical protein